LRPGEVLIAESGGTFVIDGITVTEKAPGGFALNLSQEYVLFLYIESSAGFAQLAAGSASAFLITPERQLAALTKPDSPLAKDINAHYNNRIDWLRDDAKRRTSR